MGALFTVNPSTASTAVDLPWIVTIGPLDDADDWEPVLCGPYERQHALALARAVVVEDDLMAVVEQVQPYVSVDQIRAGIGAARAIAALENQRADLILGETPESAVADAVLSHEEIQGGGQQMIAPPEHGTGLGRGTGPDGFPEDVPGPDQVREGFVRVAKRLAES